MSDAATRWNLLPMPAGAPPPGTCVRIERPEPGLAVLILDPPHRKIAVFDAPLLRDLDLALAELERDTTLRGMVLTGRDPLSFAAGADVEAIAGLADPAAARAIVSQVHALFLRLERLRARKVAAVGGPVPGGAYEICLCCDAIVLADDEQSRIGLPETMLGILPGWGGTHRLPERAGLPAALDAILTGSLQPARKALKSGLVDRLAAPQNLLRVATEIAMGRAPNPRRGRGLRRWLVDRNPLARAVIAAGARRAVLAKTRGHYPAPLVALELAVRAPGRSRADAARLEADAIATLITGPICKNLVAIFFAGEAAKKLGRGPDGAPPPPLARAAVIGGGVMGGAIASLLAERGLDARLVDLDRKAVDAALLAHRQDVAKALRRRRLLPHSADAAVDRLAGAVAMDGLGRAQIVIEAVAERIEVKSKVFAALAAATPSDCILATNTSSLSVSAIARAVPHPERVVGLHFFNPVKRMPLVEVVRGEATGDAAVVAAAALALRLGKTPVIVRDVAGFLVNRLLGPYLDEAVRLFADGADPARLDRLMLEFGMPMGPLRLLDEVGLDIAAHASASLHAAYGARMTPCPAIAALATSDRLGVKTGRGFYVHPPRGKGEPRLADDLARFQTGRAARALADQQLTDRMLLAMANEAARCVEEEVVASAQMLDLATVYGMGFAPFRGGLLRWVESVGRAEVAARLRGIASAPDVAARPGGSERFSPAAWFAR
jgi:3-hydroxyacyl-CoA dehydrogenase/enoyl-CoA hydratase/3-hydroxybutyryl-CoA epimerase